MESAISQKHRKLSIEYHLDRMAQDRIKLAYQRIESLADFSNKPQMDASTIPTKPQSTVRFSKENCQ